LQKHFSKDDFFWAEDFQRLKPEVFPHLLLEPMDIGSAGFRINSPLGNILVRPSKQNKRITEIKENHL
jgi:hypothetical protein